MRGWVDLAQTRGFDISLLKTSSQLPLPQVLPQLPLLLPPRAVCFVLFFSLACYSFGPGLAICGLLRL